MTAAHAVLHTYELVEQIVSYLDRASIHRCERISKVFRTVALESPAIAPNLIALTPVRSTEIKRLTIEEKNELERLANMDYIPPGGINLNPRATFRHQLVSAPYFDYIPHYARPTKFQMNPHLDPRLQHPAFGLCDVRGTTVFLRLPELEDFASLVSSNHYATNPAISVVMMKLRDHGEDHGECMLQVKTGIRVGDLVRTQKAMLKTLEKYGGGCCKGYHSHQCVAVFGYDTLTSRMRHSGSDDPWTSWS